MSDPHSLLPRIDHRSSFDIAVLALVSLHILFSLASAAFVLHFHLHSAFNPAGGGCCSRGPSPSLRRRIRLLLRLNSLWPVRLLLLLFASLLSLSELLRLPLRHPYLCDAYALASQSFAEPAFFATLLYLLRISSSENNKPSPSLSFVSAFSIAISAASPFILLHSAFLFLWPWALRKLDLPLDLLASVRTSNSSGHCTHPLYGTLLLAFFGALYVPMFISVCWTTVNVVINKRLRVRLYALALVVVFSLSTQVASLAAASLWSPNCDASQALGILSFVAILICAAVGQGILVVQPVIDALAIVQPDGPTAACRKKEEEEEEEDEALQGSTSEDQECHLEEV